MPIHKVEGGWQWGSHGHVYSSRAGAERQAAAAYAHGYEGDATGAGIALRAPSGKLLFLKRSEAGDHPGEWCFPGGKIEAGEDPYTCAARELYEEAGIIPAGKCVAIDTGESGFVTFSGEADYEVKPVLNLEHTEYIWADPLNPPNPLHPGVAATLKVIDSSSERLSRKIAELVNRGFPQKQAVRIAYEEERHGGIHDAKKTRDFAGYYAPERAGKTRRITPEGYLVLEGVPVGRIGQQIYAASEISGIEPNGSGYIVVERLPEEVFRPETLASGEGKDFVIEHPPEGVDPENWKNHTVGHMQNLRRGEGIEDDLILADIIVKDPLAIEYVNKYLPELSLGYVADYEQTEPGKAIQRNIIINHVAGVKSGRAGARVAVRDSSTGETSMAKKTLVWKAVRDRLIAMGLKSADADTLETEFETSPTADSKEVKDAELMSTISGINDSLKKMNDRMDAYDKRFKDEDDAKAARDSAAAAEKEKKDKEGKEEEKAEETGDTIIEAESPGSVLNLGKTWTGAMTGDSAAPEPVFQAIVSRAEILSPGIKAPTADSIKGTRGKVLTEFMRSALKAHVATSDGAAHFANFSMGKKVDELAGHALVGAFNGTSQLARAKNNQSATRTVQGRTTGDFSRPKTIADINKQNSEFWAKQGGATR